MKFQVRDGICSIMLGLLLGIVGVNITGYVAAVAISEKYLTLLSPEFTQLISDVITQFLGFGVLAIGVGVILGYFSSRWVLTSILCYIGFMLYLSVDSAFVYRTEIMNPYVSLACWWLFPSYFVLPVCLTLSNFWATKRDLK